MKTFLITTALYGTTLLFCRAQTLELKISTPQPRLGQSFLLSVELDTVANSFFSLLSNQFTLSTRSPSDGISDMGINAVATKIGKNKIGPLSMIINGKKYTTNTLEFDVVDSLPAVDKGFWIRTNKINDTTVLLLTDQRMPAVTYYERNGTSQSSTTQKSDEDKEIKLTETDTEVDNAKVNMKFGRSEMQSIQLPTRLLNFQSCFWIYKITILDKKKPVTLHKIDFTDLPAYYKFEDIKIN